MSTKKTANMAIKYLNRTNIFQLLYRQEPKTKQDIVSALHLCLPTVTQNINQLVEEGLAAESGSIGNTGGRRAKTYSIVKNARTAIGLDITRNHVTTVIVNLTGEVCYRVRIRHAFSRTDSYYQFLGKQVENAVGESGINPSHLLGVGIGVPGLITEDNQSVFYGEILNFSGATCSEFSKYIPYRTALYNDANAAGFAELWARKELNNAFYIMLSNNIGGSIVIRNQIYTGNFLRSGEVGHIRIVPDGRPCYCGQRGCVDAYCAATELSSLTGGDLSAFFKLLKGDDEKALDIWNQYLDYLALTIINVYMLFDSTIILGGYVGEFLDDYIDDLRERVKALNPFSDNADFLWVCSYKTEAIAAGAALNFIADFVNSI